LNYAKPADKSFVADAAAGCNGSLKEIRAMTFYAKSIAVLYTTALGVGGTTGVGTGLRRSRRRNEGQTAAHAQYKPSCSAPRALADTTECGRQERP
jgi:hypothetical protein